MRKYIECGDGVMETQQTFPFADEGSIPISPHHFKIAPTTFSKCKFIFKNNHYKRDHIGGGIDHILALNKGYLMYGAAIIGSMRQEDKYSEGMKIAELRRFALIPQSPKNLASYFLSKIVWWLKKNTNLDKLYSYSDLTVGHEGIIYKAANFQYVKTTAPTVHVIWRNKRYHPRSLTIDRDYSRKLRIAVENGDTRVVKGKPKKLWVYNLTTVVK